MEPSSDKIELPPSDSKIEDVISWFRDRYKHPDVESKVTYLINIMTKKRLHIKDYRLSNTIGDWKIVVEAGPLSYHPNFKPVITPDAMISSGIFGGLSIMGIETEIPIDWIIYGIFHGKINCDDYFPSQILNKYMIVAEPYPLINQQDNRYFFHWFCRYYLGRRGSEDDDMIALWNANAKKYISYINQSAAPSLMLRQILLQWSINW